MDAKAENYPGDFPWDSCRRIFSSPEGPFSLHCLRGFSPIDAEHLMSLAFLDAKVLMEEYVYLVESRRICDAYHNLHDAGFLMSIIDRAQFLDYFEEEPYCILVAKAFLFKCTNMQYDAFLHRFFDQFASKRREVQVSATELATLLLTAMQEVKEHVRKLTYFLPTLVVDTLREARRERIWAKRLLLEEKAAQHKPGRKRKDRDEKSSEFDTLSVRDDESDNEPEKEKETEKFEKEPEDEKVDETEKTAGVDRSVYSRNKSRPVLTTFLAEERDKLKRKRPRSSRRASAPARLNKVEKDEEDDEFQDMHWWLIEKDIAKKRAKETERETQSEADPEREAERDGENDDDEFEEEESEEEEEGEREPENVIESAKYGFPVYGKEDFIPEGWEQGGSPAYFAVSPSVYLSITWFAIKLRCTACCYPRRAPPAALPPTQPPAPPPTQEEAAAVVLPDAHAEPEGVAPQNAVVQQENGAPHNPPAQAPPLPHTSLVLYERGVKRHCPQLQRELFVSLLPPLPATTTQGAQPEVEDITVVREKVLLARREMRNKPQTQGSSSSHTPRTPRTPRSEESESDDNDDRDDYDGERGTPRSQHARNTQDARPLAHIHPNAAVHAQREAVLRNPALPPPKRVKVAEPKEGVNLVNRRQKKNRRRYLLFVLNERLISTNFLSLVLTSIPHQQAFIKTQKKSPFFDDTPQIKSENKLLKVKEKDRREYYMCEDDIRGQRRTPYVPIKGLVPLSNFRFRVQINSFMQEKRKFSRNSTCVSEALWVFEMCILVSDRPADLDHMIQSGNYPALIVLRDEFFMFSSVLEYYVMLGRWVAEFHRICAFDKLDSRYMPLGIENFNKLVVQCPMLSQAVIDAFAVPPTEEANARRVGSIAGRDILTPEARALIVKAATERKSLQQMGTDVLTLFSRFTPNHDFPRMGILRDYREEGDDDDDDEGEKENEKEKGKGRK